jgi:Flp pilus assembly protein TadG
MSRRYRDDYRVSRVQRLGDVARLLDLATDDRGVAALELALLAPTLLLLLMGIFDFGEMTYTVMQVRAAAHAGTQYVYQTIGDQTTCTTSGITSAVTSATSLTVTATPAPSCTVKACVTNNVIVATSGSTCPSGDPPGTYATVSAQANFSPIAPWSGLIFPSTITASSTIRYQ